MLLRASSSPSTVFHSSDVSSLFPFCIDYVFDDVCQSGSLNNDGVLSFSLICSPWLVDCFQASASKPAALSGGHGDHTDMVYLLSH